METHRISIKDQQFVMHPLGGLFWEHQSMLLISDVHLGKVSHFRKFGAAVPQAAVLKNFELLSKSVSYFSPKTVCFMGDLFHSSLNKEWHLFEDWVAKLDCKIVLVAGNHDIISPLKYQALGIQVVSEIRLDGFLLTHHPQECENFFNFSGHIHPAVRLQGQGRQTIRLACFFKSKTQLILPAFGEFTGTFTLKPTRGDEVYTLVENSVVKI